MAGTKKDKPIKRSVYLSEKVDKALQAHMKAQNLKSITVAIEDALEYALFPEHRDDRNKEMMKLYGQLLYSFNEHRKKTARDFAIVQESVFQLALDMYKHMEPYHESEEEKRHERATARLDDFMNRIARQLPEQRTMKEEK